MVNKIDAAGDLALAKLRRALPGRGVRLGAHRRRAGPAAQPNGRTGRTHRLDRRRHHSRTTAGDLVARMHDDGRVDATEHTESGTRIKAQVPAALAAGLRPFVTT